MRHLLGAMLVILPCDLWNSAAGWVDNKIHMQQSRAGTFYVPVYIEGLGTVDFLLDTGSSYTTINEKTLARLKGKGQVHYVKALKGVLADGSTKAVRIYSINTINIGGRCSLQNVEVAVFPDQTRQILGLSALGRATSFIFSRIPPELELNDCSHTSLHGSPPQASALP